MAERLRHMYVYVMCVCGSASPRVSLVRQTDTCDVCMCPCTCVRCIVCTLLRPLCVCGARVCSVTATSAASPRSLPPWPRREHAWGACTMHQMHCAMCRNRVPRSVIICGRIANTAINHSPQASTVDMICDSDHRSIDSIDSSVVGSATPARPPLLHLVGYVLVWVRRRSAGAPAAKCRGRCEHHRRRFVSRRVPA